MGKTLSKDKKLIIFLLIVLIFLIGNRYALLIQYHDALGTTFLAIPVYACADFFKSFAESFLGFKVGMDIFSISFGILFNVSIYIAYKRRLNKRHNYRYGEEHGSARYGNIEEEANELKDTDFYNNMLLSDKVSISMDTRKTFLNDNLMVIGGSGSGKTRFHVKPNILQMNCNYIITDPKLGLVPEVSNAFLKNGYEFKILNLKDMSRSMCYNPFKYFKKANDVLKFINSLISNTSKENANSGGDDFFVKSEIALLTAIVFYIMACGKDNEKQIGTLMDLIDLAEASEEDENMESPLDIMFQELNERNAIMKENEMLDKSDYGYLAERQYRLYKKAAGKTAKSILISVGVRMGIFNLPELKHLLSKDELDLESIGKPNLDENGKMIKTVLFVGISDSDSTFTFIASLLYQQLFDILYTIADEANGSRLPIHTRFMLDEFANIGKIPDFEIKIATMRSREISVCVLLQNLAQLKNLYKDSWETIFGNCDTTLFLGGKEPSTLEYFSKLIGNTTIDHLSISENKGGSNNGSYSQSNNLISRPLIAPDEIGRLGTMECLTHVRGKHIFRDKKYDLFVHPNIELTTDSKNVSDNIFNLSEYLNTNQFTNNNKRVDYSTFFNA